jgi:RasGEF domain
VTASKAAATAVGSPELPSRREPRPVRTGDAELEYEKFREKYRSTSLTRSITAEEAPVAARVPSLDRTISTPMLIPTVRSWAHQSSDPFRASHSLCGAGFPSEALLVKGKIELAQHAPTTPFPIEVAECVLSQLPSGTVARLAAVSRACYVMMRKRRLWREALIRHEHMGEEGAPTQDLCQRVTALLQSPPVTDKELAVVQKELVRTHGGEAFVRALAETLDAKFERLTPEHADAMSRIVRLLCHRCTLSTSELSLLQVLLRGHFWQLADREEILVALQIISRHSSRRVTRERLVVDAFTPLPRRLKLKICRYLPSGAIAALLRCSQGINAELRVKAWSAALRQAATAACARLESSADPNSLARWRLWRLRHEPSDVFAADAHEISQRPSCRDETELFSNMQSLIPAAALARTSETKREPVATICALFDHHFVWFMKHESLLAMVISLCQLEARRTSAEDVPALYSCVKDAATQCHWMRSIVTDLLNPEHGITSMRVEAVRRSRLLSRHTRARSVTQHETRFSGKEFCEWAIAMESDSVQRWCTAFAKSSQVDHRGAKRLGRALVEHRVILGGLRLSSKFSSKGAYAVDSELNDTVLLGHIARGTFRGSGNQSRASMFWLHPPADIAATLTVIEQEHFRKIHFSEFFRCAWNKESTWKLAPNIRNCIARFNQLTDWIANQVMEPEKVKDRAKRFEQVIRVAEELRKLKNYHTLVCLVNALNHTALFRMKHTRSRVSLKLKERFMKLEELTSVESNSVELRREMEAAADPSIPYLGLFLHDLIFFDEAATMARGELDDEAELQEVDIQLREQVYSVICGIQSRQEGCLYPVTTAESLMSTLSSLEAPSEKELFDMSLQKEPREG